MAGRTGLEPGVGITGPGSPYDEERGSYVALVRSEALFGGKKPRGGLGAWLPRAASDALP